MFSCLRRSDRRESDGIHIYSHEIVVVSVVSQNVLSVSKVKP